MSSQDIYTYTALDIGSSTVKVLIGEMNNDQLHVIGVGNVQSDGIRKGAIVDIEATVKSIEQAIDEAERMTGIQVTEVVLGVPANQAMLQKVRGVVAVQSDTKEITDDDLHRVIESANVLSLPMDRDIVTIVPEQFIVDNLDEIKDPRGMLGTRLELEATLITTSKTLLHNIIRCTERAGLNVKEIYLQPLAAGQYALTDDEKNQGTAYIDIGAGSTTIAVFEAGFLTHTSAIPIGGEHVTQDLSIVLSTTTERSEYIKHTYGHAFYDDASETEYFDVPSRNGEGVEQYNQRYLSEIIGARLEEIFEFVIDELARLGVKDLPGGIVLSGGMSKLEGIAQLARQVMRTRVRIYTPDFIGVREPSYSTAVGLIQYAHKEDEFYMSNANVAPYDDYANYDDKDYTSDDDYVDDDEPQEKGKFSNIIKKAFKGFF